MRRALLITTAVWLSAAPALAQDDGVFVDPDSPTAKEYAIPLDSARRQAAGQNRQPAGAGSATPAPRFGEGVGDEQASAGGSGGGGNGGNGNTNGGTGNGGSGQGTPGSTGTGSSQASGSGLPSVVASRPGAPDGGGAGTTLLIVGGGAGLLLLGAGAGYALRRRPAPGT